MLCDFDSENTCNRCGFVCEKVPHYRNCQTIEEIAREHLAEWSSNRIRVRPLLLGSAIAAGLSGIGVTEERIKKITGVADCGCKQRANALDSIGVAASQILQRAANWAMSSVLPYEVTEQDVAAMAQAIYESPLTNHGLKRKAAEQRPQGGTSG